MDIISYAGEVYKNVDYEDLSIHRECWFYPEIRHKEDILLCCRGIVEAEQLLENIRQCMNKGVTCIRFDGEPYKTDKPSSSQFNKLQSVYSIYTNTWWID